MKDTQNKDSLVFLPIVHYVYHLVSRAGSQPEQLPGELELCEKFGVARGTVRRALSRLIERNIVIQLPKRRGYFSNPHFSNHGASVIGVLVGNGYIASMAHSSVPLFTSFVKGLQPLQCDYNFMTLPSSDPQTLRALIECTSVDGLLWIAPEDCNIPAIESMLQASFPLVVIENIHQPNTIFPSSNYLHHDLQHIADKCTDQLLRDGCHHPVYCSDSVFLPKLIQKNLERNNIPFGEDRILSGTDTLGDSITEFLDAKNLDSIVCDGDICRYLTTLEALASHPAGKQVRMYLEKGLESSHIPARFADMNICYLDLEDVLVRQTRVGKRAGVLMKRLLKKSGSKHFQNELYQ